MATVQSGDAADIGAGFSQVPVILPLSAAAAKSRTQAPPPAQPKLGRVLHVINGEHYAGAERVQDLLADRLPHLGYEVSFACIKPGRFPGARRSVHADLFELPMQARFDLRVAGKLWRLIRGGRYDLVHAHTPRSALVGGLAATLARVPWIYHVHSPTSRDTAFHFRNRVNAATEWLSLLGASHVITVSESLAHHMRQQGFAPEHITVVPNGVPQLPPLVRPRPTGSWTLGAVALFRPRKGLEVLLDAMALLKQQRLPVRLRAVGPFETPEYEQQLKRHVQNLNLQDSVEWTGFCQDVNSQLQEIDLFVLPSLFGEGMPMVVLEAMAAGIPVVATRVEGIPEVVRDGREGTLAAPGDPYDLAHAISRIIQGPLDWQRLREQARQRQVTVFSDQAMAAGTAAVYKDLLV